MPPPNDPRFSRPQPKNPPESHDIYRTAGPLGRCRSCGLPLDAEPHGTDSDCVDALHVEIRRLRATQTTKSDNKPPTRKPSI